MTALDIASDNIRHIEKEARENGLFIEALQGDVNHRLPFPDNTFQGVYAHLAVHYFDDETTENIIQEIYRVLKPGGYFFVKCKSVDDPLYGKGKKIADDMYLDDHVRHFFRKEYMASLLQKWTILSLRRSTSVYMDYRSCFIEAIAQK